MSTQQAAIFVEDERLFFFCLFNKEKASDRDILSNSLWATMGPER